MKIKWLQFADLHFSTNEHLDADSVRVALLDCLSELRKETEFDYVFIAGDLANKNDYTATKTIVKDIISRTGVKLLNVFWAVGNHDIERGSKMRNSIINGIRKAENPSLEFENVMKDENKHDFLTKDSMSDYIREYNQLFNRKLSTTEIYNAHIGYSLEHFNLVVLNTCLTSCDDNDKDNLLIAEPTLLQVFNKCDKSKPIIVLGHHGKNFFQKDQQEKLSTLFERAEVDIYLCGHASSLGYTWFNDIKNSIPQITCGNGTLDGNFRTFSFMCGEYDTDIHTIQIITYSYSNNSKTFHKDDHILSSRTQDNIFVLHRLVTPSEPKYSLEDADLFYRSRRYYKLLEKRNQPPNQSNVEKTLFPKVQLFDSSEHGKNDETLYNLIDILPKNFALSKKQKNLLVIGEGGTGKTTALLHFWETLLENEEELPLYIPLNEYTTESDFIQKYIKNCYEQINILKLKRNFVLLLDGFNEISRDTLPLIKEIKKLLDEKTDSAKFIRIIITSRDKFIDIEDYQKIGFQQYKIQPLDSDVVQSYLTSNEIVDIVKLREELYSPMMLTLYVKTDDLQKKIVKKKQIEKDEIFEKPNSTRGELLYNYMLCQIFNCEIHTRLDEISSTWYTLFEVAPFIAHTMESSSKLQHELLTDKTENFHIKEKDLIQLISKFCKDSPVEQQIKYIPNQHLQNLVNRYRSLSKTNTNKVKDILIDQHLLREENKQYTFQHQFFRDFLSACHIANVIRKSLDVKPFNLPSEASSRVWPDYICEMLGNYYGDYRNCKGYDQLNHTDLHELLNRLRLPYKESKYAISNIIETWRKARDNRIIGENFKSLDLSQVALNNVILSEITKSKVDPKQSTSFDGSIISDGTLLPQGHSGAVRSAMYSGDGKRILSASYDGTVKEWDRETGKCIHTFEGHTNRVRSAVYSPDDRHILSASYDRTIREWDRETGKCIHTFEGHTDIVQDAIYSGDGKRILSASYDGTVKEWDRKTEQCLQTIKVSSKRVNDVEYSPDGTCILSAFLTESESGAVKEWDRQTGQCLHTYEGHTGNVCSAVYSKDGDGKRILSASYDGTVKEWDRETQECLRTFRGHADKVRCAVYSADGKHILSASEDGTIKEWDRETKTCYHTFKGTPNWTQKAVFSADGYRVLTAVDRNIMEWDRETGAFLHILRGHSKLVSSAVYSADGKHILSASEDGTIREWNRETGSCILNITVSSDEANIAVYSKDETRILYALYDGTVKEWNRETGKCIDIVRGHNKKVCSMLYSVDGYRVLIAYEDGVIKEWDRNAQQSLKVFNSHNGAVLSVVYSADGKYILSASADRDVKEWDRTTGECIRSFVGHKSRVYSAVYSTDGSHVLSASYDSTVREWKREKPKEYDKFESQFNGVQRAVYSGDGKRILSISDNGVIMEWDRKNSKHPSNTHRLFHGVFIKNCSFKGCNFLTTNIKQIVHSYSGNMLNTFLTAVKISKLRNEPRKINIDLDPEVPKNLLITGSNGSGKTSLLNQLNIAVNNIINSSNNANNEVSATFSGTHSDKVQVLQLECNNGYYRVVFIPAGRSYNKDGSSNFWNKLDEIQGNIHRCNTEKNLEDEKYWSELLEKYKNALPQLFANDTIKTEYKYDPEANKHRFRVYHELEGDPERVFELNRDALPDGYTSVLNIFWAIIQPHWDTKIPFSCIRGLVLIDELETHLHVRMQKTLLPFLTDFFPEVQFIVATHSPYVLNSAKNVVIYDMEKNKLTEIKNNETYGLQSWYVNDISQKLLDCPEYSEKVEKTLKKYDDLCEEGNKANAYQKYVELNEMLLDDVPLKRLLREQMKWLDCTDDEEVKPTKD